MAWSVPMTWVANTTITAAQLNAQIRDNMNETATAKATTPSYWFVSQGTNTLAERAITSDRITTQQTTASTSYVNLPTVGPTVTVTTGVLALAWFACQMFSSGAGSCWASFAVSGASAVSAGDDRAVTCEASSTNSFRMATAELQSVTSGSNTFQAKYRVGSLTGTFDDRHLIVMAL